MADALEWLRRHGITGVNYRREEYHYVFFESFEEHWPKVEFEERHVASPEAGVDLVYRTYPTRIDPDTLRDPRKVAGGKRTIRCFKFFHAQKNYGPAFTGEIPFGQRKGGSQRGELL